MIRMRLTTDDADDRQQHQREDQLRDRHEHIDEAAEHLVDPAAQDTAARMPSAPPSRNASIVVTKAMPIVLRAP